MPLYTFKEFAELTGKQPKHMRTYEKRSQIVITEDRKIDSNNPINALFIEKNKPITTEEKEITTPQKKTTSRKKKTETKKEPENKVVVKSNELVNLELEKKRLEVEKLRRENEISNEKLKVVRGESVDLSKTILVVKSYSDSFKKDLSQQIQNHIQEICTRHDIPNGKAGDYKLKVLEIINISSSKASQTLNDL